MNAHEQVRLGAAGDGHAAAEAHEVVRVAGHDGLHAGIVVDERGEALGDLEHDRLLSVASAADGARILAAVAGVDHDDELGLDGLRGLLRLGWSGGADGLLRLRLLEGRLDGGFGRALVEACEQ